MSGRVYLDWNASAPLRVEAREAMIAAMDLVGNPSSVHADGRAAKSLLEKARNQVAEAIGAVGQDIAFTSGATEASKLAVAGRNLFAAPIEHDAMHAVVQSPLNVATNGVVTIDDAQNSTLQLANSETGVLQDLPKGLALSDITQGFGKVPFAFNWAGIDMAIASAHKIGGPKGVGVLVLRQGIEIQAQILGGGQEMGRRAGTENLIGIAGFGAAAEAAAKDLANGIWDEVAQRRNMLEDALQSADDSIIIGANTARLPNTTCIASPGWKGETQVMQMDLAGFSVSAGSACSSGKVKTSRVLAVMGYDELTSMSAIRVSIGPETKDEDVLRFADVWLAAHKKYRVRAA